MKLKVKIFKSYVYRVMGGDAMENAVNDFIEESDIKVLSIQPIRMSNNPSIDSIMVVYEEV